MKCQVAKPVSDKYPRGICKSRSSGGATGKPFYRCQICLVVMCTDCAKVHPVECSQFEAFFENGTQSIDNRNPHDVRKVENILAQRAREGCMGPDDVKKLEMVDIEPDVNGALPQQDDNDMKKKVVKKPSKTPRKKGKSY